MITFVLYFHMKAINPEIKYWMNSQTSVRIHQHGLQKLSRVTPMSDPD